MKTKPFNPDELNLISLAQDYADEGKARGLLESLLWPKGPVCPHCKNHKEKPIYKLQPKSENKTAVRAGVYKCGACRKQFTVTVGTIFSDSHIKISTWFMAVFILCSSKKAVSALQLSRMLGVTHKTAWFMLHRIRHSMSPKNPLGKLLSGIVEVDETFVGGVGDARTKFSRKTPVVALIERGGNMQTRVVASVSQQNLGRCLRECVSKDAILCTDEHHGYKRAGREYKAHHTVVHSKFQYILKKPDGVEAGVNHCESFFSLLKRGVYGAWHNVSREHLPKYANEFAFRWNTRKLSDGARMVNALGLIEGKRLMYRRPLN